ncbi:MAG TPA: tetratricopeptide repeat protein [Polyangiaceae bacterium]|nr:tetratricopeptide repeat protein [Polyangiaceae bacterium]
MVALLATLALSSGAHAQQPSRPTAAQIARARMMFQRGNVHYDAGRLNEALACFLGAWRLVPNPELAYNVARTYERMSEHSRAIEFYRRYLADAAADEETRADVERRIHEMEEVAQRQRSQIRSLPPSHDELAQEARTFFERGVSMYRRRQYPAALAAFTAAYNYTRPTPPAEVLYNLAMTAERLDGHRQDAIDYYREYARTLPRDSRERREINRHVAELRAQR